MPEPVDRLQMLLPRTRSGFHSVPKPGTFPNAMTDASMQACAERMPDDVLIVEDDPIIALDFEDTILGFGVKTVRIAGTVSRALAMIDDRVPDFALLDVGLVQEKSFAIGERLEALKIPFAFVTGYGVDVKLPALLAQKPRLLKPCASDALAVLLKRGSIYRIKR